MVGFFSQAWEQLRLSVLYTNFLEVAQGFYRAFQIKRNMEYRDAIQRGASPNQFELRINQIISISASGDNVANLLSQLKWTRTSWLIAPFMMFSPLLINGWPRANVENTYLNQAIHALDLLSASLRMDNRWYMKYLLAPIVRGAAWVLKKLPRIHNQRIIRGLDFRCHTSQFLESIRGVRGRGYDVIQNHVLDNTILLPPMMSEDNLDSLVNLFDKLDWKSITIQKIIADNKKHDWRLVNDGRTGVDSTFELSDQSVHADFLKKLEGLPEAYSQQVLYLRNNLMTFIHRLRTNDLHSVKVGAEDLARRYAKAITRQLVTMDANSRCSQKRDDERRRFKNSMYDVLIRLSYETGGYCGIALLRTLQGNYQTVMIPEIVKEEDSMPSYSGRFGGFMRHYGRYLSPSSATNTQRSVEVARARITNVG